ncbi:cobalamin biosynthesis central domain-containing protein [Thiospirillum jenense]|uniref:Cobalamin biosynthesis protein CbiG n=1 Tax=Thiospirillum jenense TaxID=1653858 RepID=A0A839HDB1_9GAMM|nr:cobalamin biosynthesis central domain-containing protein [Thiospirillum jenense]MBB1126935.1 cobalamin biosynthesis protein CbiG [Thiospirillum jenense]
MYYPPHLKVLTTTTTGVQLTQRLYAQLPTMQLYAPAQLTSIITPAHLPPTTWYHGCLRDLMPTLFTKPPTNQSRHAIVAILAIGAVVRLIAPYLIDKYHDPAVIVLDQTGQFVVPILSGHLGGGNALAAHLAQLLNATAVITTASDCQLTLAVDLLGQELGWRVEAETTALRQASAAMVNKHPVALIQENGSDNWWRHHANGRTGDLPSNLHQLSSLDMVDVVYYQALLWISHRVIPPAFAQRFSKPIIWYKPP